MRGPRGAFCWGGAGDEVMRHGVGWRRRELEG